MKVLLKLIFSLLIVQLPCLASEPQVKGATESLGSIKTNFDCACKYYDQTSYDLAIPKFLYVIANTKDLSLKTTSQFRLGVMYFNLKDYKTAHKFLRAVSEQGFNMQLKIEAHDLLRRLFKCTQKEDKASYHNKLAKETQKELGKCVFEIHNNLKLAMDLMSRCEHSEAKELLKKLRKNNFDLVIKAQANHLLGEIYMADSQYAKAAFCFREAAIQKDCPLTRRHCCKLLAQMIIDGQSLDFASIRQILLGLMHELLEQNESELFANLKVLFKQILTIESQIRNSRKTFED